MNRTEPVSIECYQKLICDMILNLTNERFLRQIYSIVYRQQMKEREHH